MMPEDKVILVGGFKELIDLCEVCQKAIVGIIDNDVNRLFDKYEFLGTDGIAFELYKKYKQVPLIIAVDKPSVRKRLVQYYSRIGFRFTSLIHPTARISKYAQLGKGVVIQTGVHVSTNAVIGDFVRLNTYSNIMHDVVVGNFTTIAPNAVVLGRVRIGELCYIGANATLLPEIQLQHGALVGAGAVVTKDVASNKIVVGNPACEAADKNCVVF